ncbi:MAG TPA: pteridine reductase [Gammaproteobacteria bacterium]|nr:pteridine reductase [Gammaproteobacteria bacterium]
MNTQKVALITGAARRIGAKIAETLHSTGFNIVLHYYRSEKDAAHLCEHFNQSRPGSAIKISANLQQMTCLKELAVQASQAWGRLDVLVNNASCFIKSPIGQADEALWQEIMDTNLKAPFMLSQLVAPQLAKTKGCIVNITDVHTETAFRDYAVYCISKAGLVSATKVLAKELGPDVRVNAISPGMIMWPEHENELAEGLKAKITNEAALKRVGSPIDIAKAVLFFVQEADYVTGQVLTVDGGRLL